MDRCSKCHESFGFSFMTHKCDPVYEAQIVLDGEDNDDWVEIRAYDHRTAAEEYAAKTDRESVEYSIVSGLFAEIWVRGENETKIKKFMVSGKTVAQYSARAI